MSRNAAFAAFGALLAIADCAPPPPPGSAAVAARTPAIGFDNRLITGQSPGGTWDTAGGRQTFEPPNSLPPGAAGIGPRVTPAFP